MMFSQFVAQHKNELENIALAVRILGMDAVLKAKSGHVGLPLGGAEMGTLLYFAVMNQDPQNPEWMDRDRFVLSAGHGAMLQYALLHLAGYDVSLQDIKNFRQLGSKTPGHPEYGHTPGIECTTGPLGQGMAHAVGMSIAERMLAARSQTENTVDHRTFVLAGDGCLMEGVTHESSSLAGHLKLNRLIVLYDDNKITIDGSTDISFTEDVQKRFEAYGWNTVRADGNDFDSLASAMDKAYANSMLPQGTTGPTLIICKTIPGKGSPQWEGKHKIHGNPMSAEDVVLAKKHLGVENTEPFFVPEKCYASAKKLIAFRMEKAVREVVSSRGAVVSSRGNVVSPPGLTRGSTLTPQGFSPSAWTQAKGKMATRVAGGKALAELAKNNPELVGGSADLAGSNLTTLQDSSFISPTDFTGRNIHFGVREHAMAAVCNGITLHGAFRAYCATFAVFSDYMRPAIRLAALMKIPTLFIFTHDSYGVGEDGPTHQPIEHAAALRAIPGLNVYRPADALETFAAWEQALLCTEKPTALLLTRQDVPDLNECGLELKNRTVSCVTEGVQKGAYLLKDFDEGMDPAVKIVLVASGSEVEIALKAGLALEQNTYEKLDGQKIKLNVRAVSCMAPAELVQNPVTLNHLIPKELPIIAVEAGITQSFGEIVGRSGAILGLNHFGASAPYSDLARHFGFTTENLITFVLNHLHLRKHHEA